MSSAPERAAVSATVDTCATALPVAVSIAMADRAALKALASQREAIEHEMGALVDSLNAPRQPGLKGNLVDAEVRLGTRLHTRRVPCACLTVGLLTCRASPARTWTSTQCAQPGTDSQARITRLSPRPIRDSDTDGLSLLYTSSAEDGLRGSDGAAGERPSDLPPRCFRLATRLGDAAASWARAAEEGPPG